jgi:hypothetical protein
MAWMVWENEPFPETVNRLEGLGIKSLVFRPCGNRPAEGNFMSVMLDNVAVLERAFPASASMVDFKPNHSIGINYGRTEAGWLLSPQYRENEEAIEIRYLWRRSRNLALDIRARWREELEQLENTTRKQKDLNVFVRFTLGFGY